MASIARRPMVLAVLAAAATAQEPTVADVLREHAAALGGRPVPAWFVIETTVHSTPKERRRTFVRRQPFALRQECTREGDKAPAVFFCDGRLALRLLDNGKVALLEGEAARLVIEAACIDGLQFLDAKAARMPLIRGPAQRLAMLPGVHVAREPAPVWPVAAMLACGTEVRLYFDAFDGRLRGLANTAFVPQRNVRFADWQPLGPLRLPATRWENRGADAPVRVTTDAVRAIDPDPALFAPIPVTPPGTKFDAGPLQFPPTEIPGSCYFMLPAVGIDRRVQLTALFDTGAGRSYLATHVADSLALPILSMRRVRGITGATGTAQRWLDMLELPGYRFPQMEIGTLELPPTIQDEHGSWPGAMLGGEILELGPVFDRTAGRLLLRATPIEPLPGTDVFTVPLLRDERDSLDEVPIEIAGHTIHAVLDSGQPVMLRLRAKTLRTAGLPVDIESWRKRGAVPLQTTGAGGGVTNDLIAQIDSFRLGRVTFERPCVQIALEDDPTSSAYHAALGAGALAMFDRVGIDRERNRLELQPGPQLVPTEDGWRVTSAGAFLGLRAREPDPLQRQRGESLPIVVEVCAGSPAAAAGIRVHDRLHTVAGASCAVPAREWRRSLWATEGVAVEVESAGGAVRRVVIQP